MKPKIIIAIVGLIIILVLGSEGFFLYRITQTQKDQEQILLSTLASTTNPSMNRDALLSQAAAWQLLVSTWPQKERDDFLAAVYKLASGK